MRLAGEFCVAAFCVHGSVHISGIVDVCVCVCVCICLHILHCLCERKYRWSHCDPACHGQWSRTFQVEEHVIL